MKHRPEVEEAARKARKELKAREDAQQAETIEGNDGFEYVRRKRVSRKKRRHLSMTVAVSEEEEAIIRAHIAGLEISFSAWARQTLFRAMGKRIPARPKRV